MCIYIMLHALLFVHICCLGVSIRHWDDGVVTAASKRVAPMTAPLSP